MRNLITFSLLIELIPFVFIEQIDFKEKWEKLNFYKTRIFIYVKFCSIILRHWRNVICHLVQMSHVKFRILYCWLI